MSFLQGQKGADVYLNVYDLNPSMNQGCYNMGLGFYHTGVHIGLNQYTFAGHQGSHTGVMEVTPKVNHPNFRQTIFMGKTDLSWRQITKILDELRQAFPGNSYHTIKKNCNTFSNCLCEAILHKSIPGFVNRLANMAKVFYQIDDFIRMRAYDPKYEVSAKQLEIEAAQNENIFEKKSGVMIG